MTVTADGDLTHRPRFHRLLYLKSSPKRLFRMNNGPVASAGGAIPHRRPQSMANVRGGGPYHFRPTKLSAGLKSGTLFRADVL